MALFYECGVEWLFGGKYAIMEGILFLLLDGGALMSIDDQIIRDPNPKLKKKKKSGGTGLNSNVVKLGLAGVLLLLILFVFIWQLFLTGGKDAAKPPAVAAAPSGGGTAPPPPTGTTPPPPPSGTAPAPDTSPPDNPPAAPPAAPPGASSPMAAPGAGPLGGPPGMPGNPGAQGPGEPTEKPPLPEDVTKWKGKDIQRAREEGNPKLIEAVAYIGGRKDYKNDATAQGLANLLKPFKPPENTPGQPNPYIRGGSAAQPDLIKAIIFALGENETPTARQTILQILQGKFPTDDERTAADAALQVMVARQSLPEFEAALLKLLAHPETFRPSGDPGVFSPAEAQRQVLELLKSQSAPEFRKKLAQQLAAADLTPNSPLGEFLLQENPSNLDAQLVLYRNEDLSKELHAQLEQFFINYGSTALGQLLGLTSEESESATAPGSVPYAPAAPPPSYAPPRPSPYAHGGGISSSMGAGVRMNPGGAPTPPYAAPPPVGPLSLTPVKLSGMEQAVRMIKQIWAGPLAESLLHQLENLRGLDKDPNTILLATAIPTDPFRAALFKLLKKRPLDGPQALDAAGAADRIVTDPGLLVLVKLLPVQRRDVQALRNGRAGGPGGYYPPPTPYGNSGATDPRQKREQAEQDWFNFSLKLLNSWRARLDARAELQKKAARKKEYAGESAPEKSADLDWPKDFKLKTACQLTWPDNAPKGLAPIAPGPLKIQFFRLEAEGQIKKTSNLLSRGQRGGKMHYLDCGIWLDILKADPERNVKRSLDIVITHADKSPYDPSIRKEENVDLEIDVLAIEIPDPAGPKEPPPDKSKHPGEKDKKVKDEGKVLRPS
jgi:hypothetical protein